MKIAIGSDERTYLTDTVIDELKKRGYRWSPGDEGRPKAWYVDMDEAKRDDEIAYLRQSIYLRDVDLFEQTLSALDRFSIRI